MNKDDRFVRTEHEGRISSVRVNGSINLSEWVNWKGRRAKKEGRKGGRKEGRREWWKEGKKEGKKEGICTLRRLHPGNTANHAFAPTSQCSFAKIWLNEPKRNFVLEWEPFLGRNLSWIPLQWNKWFFLLLANLLYRSFTWPLMNLSVSFSFCVFLTVYIYRRTLVFDWQYWGICIIFKLSDYSFSILLGWF